MMEVDAAIVAIHVRCVEARKACSAASIASIGAWEKYHADRRPKSRDAAEASDLAVREAQLRALECLATFHDIAAKAMGLEG